MKQLKRLLSLTGLFIAALFLLVNMESCSSHKGIVSCPDIHHGSLAMRHVHYHNATLAHNHHKDASQQQAANATPQQNNRDANQTASGKTNNVTPQPANDGITGGGFASASSDMPNLKNSKEMFKLLTEDERQQVKSTVSTMLGKHKFLKKIVEKRLDKMDKRYPAPAQSSLRGGGGGGLDTGEILAIVAGVCALTFFLGIAALVIGIIALHMINNNGGAEWAKIIAIVAIILGALELLILILWLVVFVAILGGVFF